jgi:hypothetical protein
MNRNDFKKLSTLRSKEAKTLLAAGQFAGAYYLAGYAIECALKACISKQTQKHDFPDKDIVKESYTHNLDGLLKTAGLAADFKTDAHANKDLETNWAVIKDWSEDVRYETTIAEADAKDLYSAITNKTNGVLPWLRKRW